MKVTVITSSIGRPSLARAIESVWTQTYQCQHMVFINGRKWHDTASGILNDYAAIENLTEMYIPDETGDCGIGPGCAGVFAGAPWLTSADIIMYLNDDDYWEPNHVESIVSLIKTHDLEWAYSLRRFVDDKGPFCDDDFDSLGFWPCQYDESQYLVDNSCFAVKTEWARKLGPAWFVPMVGDRVFLQTLKDKRLAAGCTGLRTVNYGVGEGTAPPRGAEYYERNTEVAKFKYHKGYPWTKPHVFRWDHKNTLYVRNV